MIIDISQEVFSCKVFPGDAAPEMRRVKSIDRGDAYNLTEFSMCAHNGTHIDAPFHFINDGSTVDKVNLKNFVGDCYVVRREVELTSADIVEIMEKARSEDASSRILLAGDVLVNADAARAFAKANIRLLGTERQTVGPEDAPAEVHNILLGAGVVLLEGLVLSDVAEGKYFLSAAPLNLAGCDGSPCRAYLMR